MEQAGKKRRFLRKSNGFLLRVNTSIRFAQSA
jgi:hypothetical protein